MTSSLVIYAAMIAVFWLKLPENAMMITVALGCASVLGAIMIAAFRLSYVTLDDEYLLCRYCGIFPKKLRLDTHLRWKVMGGQLHILTGKAELLKMPDSDAARQLMTAARIRAAE